MVESKPYHPLESNESNIPTDRNKGKSSNTKNYRGKKPRNKPSPEPETETDFQGRCTELEGYNFDLDQEHPENSPEQQRNWSDTLEQHTVKAASNP